MKKGKKLFISAFFSVIGTIGLAGCDMGGNQNSPSSSGSEKSFINAVYSDNFKKDLGGETLDATRLYFATHSEDNKPFAEPNNYGRGNINWTSDRLSIADAKYRADNDEGMNGIVSIGITGIFDYTKVAYFPYAVTVANDGHILNCSMDGDISDGVWNFLDNLNNKEKIKSFSKQDNFKPSGTVIEVKENSSGKFEVGSTTKDEQEKGFMSSWVMNATIILSLDNQVRATIDISDGNIESIK